MKVDGDFGPKTSAAAKAFQKAINLVHGIVGPITWNRLLLPSRINTWQVKMTCGWNREATEAEVYWTLQSGKQAEGWATASSGELAFEPETLEMEGPKGKATIGGPPSKTRIELDMVLDAIDKGTTDPNKLTDLVFHKRHPELGGRRLNNRSERSSKSGMAFVKSAQRCLHDRCNTKVG